MRALLRGHEPVDERERTSLERIERELGRLHAPYDQDADLTHVTGSAIVVGRRGVLLHLHRKLGLWLQPGGHLELGEAPWDAAMREAIEETGVVVAHPPRGPSFVHADVHVATAGHVHLDFRFLLHPSADDEPRPPPGESQEVRWYSWDDALVVADDGLRGGLVAVARSAIPRAAATPQSDGRPPSGKR